MLAPHSSGGTFPTTYPTLVGSSSLSAQIMGSMRLTKVLMDVGSRLNILYAKTLNQMKIPRRSLHLSGTPLYGIVPGN